jgi:hypothetical protein
MNFELDNLVWPVLSITAQGCITDAHSLPEITEKMVCGVGVRPPYTIFSEYSWNFAL